MRCKK